MTLAEIFRQKGEREGRLEAIQETALNFLKLGISKEQVRPCYKAISARSARSFAKKYNKALKCVIPAKARTSAGPGFLYYFDVFTVQKIV